MVQINDLEQTLASHPFAAGLKPDVLRILAGCCSNAVYHPGDGIFREGEQADNFYLIRQGMVTLEIHVPQGEPVVVETLQSGEIFGWSWMVPPYRWSNDARAGQPTRILKLDAACLRQKMQDDHALGYEIYKRFLPIMAHRLAGNRLRIVERAVKSAPLAARHKA